MSHSTAKPNYDDFEINPPREALGSSFDPREPIFVLRAQDVLSAPIVRAWCEMAVVLGANPEKIKEARQIALAMEQWDRKKVPD
jgi:hypothetical protein